jgi:hypothetical protein
MYACAHRIGSDFSRGCVLQVFARSFLVTPPPSVVREWLYPSTVSGDSHCGEYLFIAPISCAGNLLQCGQLGILRTHKGGAMQDAGYGLLRILIPRTRMNKGKK